LPERELSIEIQNPYSFTLSMEDFELLIFAHDVKTSFQRIQAMMLFLWSVKNHGAGFGAEPLNSEMLL